MSSNIYIYNGQGCSGYLATCWQKRLEEQVTGEYRVEVATSFEDITRRGDPVACVLFPGGHAIETAISLGMDYDQKWVKRPQDVLLSKKISVIGSCAGGILSSSALFERPSGNRSLQENFTYSLDAMGLTPYPALAPILRRTTQYGIDVQDVQVHDVVSADGNIPMVHLFPPAFYLNDMTQLPLDARVDVLGRYTLPQVSAHLQRGRNGGIVFQEPIDGNRLVESYRYQAPDGTPVVLVGSHPEIFSQEVASQEFLENVVYHPSFEHFDRGSCERRLQDVSQWLGDDAGRVHRIRTIFGSAGLSLMPQN